MMSRTHFGRAGMRSQQATKSIFAAAGNRALSPSATAHTNVSASNRAKVTQPLAEENTCLMKD